MTNDVASAPASAENPRPFLGPTSITSDHVQQAFRELVKDDQLKLVKVTGEVVAAGQGFTSYIMRLALTWSDEDKKRHRLPESTILKALSKDAIEKLFEHFKLDSNMENGQNVFTQMLNQGHKTECIVYELFGCENAKPPVPVARAFGTWSGDSIARPHMILLEDLGDRATVLGEGSDSLNFQQILSIAETLADLHVWCLTSEEKWRHKFETFEDRMVMYDSFAPMIQQGIQRAKDAYPDIFDTVDNEKLKEYFDPKIMLVLASKHKPYMPDVLIHGDFWANNIMFNKLADGKMGDELVALIDWQLSILGNPMVDIGRLLSMSVDAHLRTAHFDDLIKRYYDRLTKKLGPDRMPKELTFDRIYKLAEEQTALNCLMMFFMQDQMQAIFAPPDKPDSEIKRERMIKNMKAGFEYASKIFELKKK
jgi:thiamine kinase-like enzyme